MKEVAVWASPLVAPNEALVGADDVTNIAMQADPRNLTNVRVGDKEMNGKDNAPKAIPVNITQISCKIIIAQTRTSNPFFLARKFIIGKAANANGQLATPSKYTFFVPIFRQRGAKNRISMMPSMSPKTPNAVPICSGESPSPPEDIGVAKTSGRKATKAISRSAKIA
jgi:hypothetical protein